MVRVCASVLFGVLVLAGCRDSKEEPAPCVPLHGRIDKDTTLYRRCSPYVFKGGIDVINDATLTIEPGTEVRFGNKDWLEISAAFTRGARLVAKGTPEAPIVLTSHNKKPWLGLWFNSGIAAGTELSHAIVRLGGGLNKHIKPPLTQGCITVTDVTDGHLTLHDVTVEGCTNAGVVLVNSRPAMSAVQAKGVEHAFLVDEASKAVVPAGASFTMAVKPE